MKHANQLAVLMALYVMSVTATAGMFDGSKVLLCATQTVNECIPGWGCDAVSQESVNLPDFFKVDAGNKVIGSANAETPVERIEHLDGKLVLQGADDGLEGVRDGLGWTMTIHEENGNMSLIAAGDGYAIVSFGTCATK